MEQYTRDDFLESAKPYEFLYNVKDDPELHERSLITIKENAHAVGVKGFESLYKLYVREKEKQKTHSL